MKKITIVLMIFIMFSIVGCTQQSDKQDMNISPNGKLSNNISEQNISLTPEELQRISLDNLASCFEKEDIDCALDYIVYNRHSVFKRDNGTGYMKYLAEHCRNAVLIENNNNKSYKYLVKVELPGGYIQNTTFYMYYEDEIWKAQI